MPYKGRDEFRHTGHFLFYRPQKNERLRDAAVSLIDTTSYLHLNEFTRDFSAINFIKDETLLRGKTYIVPNGYSPLVRPLVRDTRPQIPTVRALYYTGDAIGRKQVLNDIIRFKKAGINSIVFDVKDIPGTICYRSSLKSVREMNTDRYRSVDNMKALIRFLRENDIYVIARIACFRDDLALKERPQWGIQSSRGGVWNRTGHELWLDPTNKEVQDYTIDLACEIASLGVDEVQFDYVRFPTEGDRGDALYAYDFGRLSRQETIARFLERAHASLHGVHANFSIDIFGVVAWGFEGDIESTGQQIELLAKHCDVISPMLYPSHFNDGFRGIKKPGDEPYYFIYHGCIRVSELAKINTIVRPWLQAFGWRVSNYNETYIHEQVRAAIEADCRGYLFWNAKNSYDTVISALTSMGRQKR